MFLEWCETHKSFEKKLPGHGVTKNQSKNAGYNDSYTRIKAIGRNSTIRPFGWLKCKTLLPRQIALAMKVLKTPNGEIPKKKLEESIPTFLSFLFG